MATQDIMDAIPDTSWNALGFDWDNQETATAGDIRPLLILYRVYLTKCAGIGLRAFGPTNRLETTFLEIDEYDSSNPFPPGRLAVWEHLWAIYQNDQEGNTGVEYGHCSLLETMIFRLISRYANTSILSQYDGRPVQGNGTENISPWPWDATAESNIPNWQVANYMQWVFQAPAGFTGIEDIAQATNIKTAWRNWIWSLRLVLYGLTSVTRRIAPIGFYQKPEGYVLWDGQRIDNCGSDWAACETHSQGISYNSAYTGYLAREIVRDETWCIRERNTGDSQTFSGQTGGGWQMHISGTPPNVIITSTWSDYVGGSWSQAPYHIEVSDKENGYGHYISFDTIPTFDLDYLAETYGEARQGGSAIDVTNAGRLINYAYFLCLKQGADYPPGSPYWNQGNYWENRCCWGGFRFDFPIDKLRFFFIDFDNSHLPQFNISQAYTVFWEKMWNGTPEWTNPEYLVITPDFTTGYLPPDRSVRGLTMRSNCVCKVGQPTQDGGWTIDALGDNTQIVPAPTWDNAPTGLTDAYYGYIFNYDYFRFLIRFTGAFWAS